MLIHSIHLILLIATLHDLEISQPDVGNAYLEAYTKGKIYFIAGKEFAAEAWKVMYSLYLKHYTGCIQVVNDFM